MFEHPRLNFSPIKSSDHHSPFSFSLQRCHTLLQYHLDETVRPNIFTHEKFNKNLSSRFTFRRIPPLSNHHCINKPNKEPTCPVSRAKDTQ